MKDKQPNLNKFMQNEQHHRGPYSTIIQEDPTNIEMVDFIHYSNQTKCNALCCSFWDGWWSASKRTKHKWKTLLLYFILVSSYSGLLLSAEHWLTVLFTHSLRLSCSTLQTNHIPSTDRDRVIGNATKQKTIYINYLNLFNLFKLKCL